jgi:Na+/H+-dicarboxylate symporter
MQKVFMSIKLSPAKKWLNTPVLYAIMILLGVISGYSDMSILKNFGLFISDVFIKIFKCISLPIIALSIIVTLSKYRADGVMQRLWRLTMCYTLGTTFVAAAISCFLYLFIHPGTISTIKQGIIEQKPNQLGYFQHIANIFPSTIFEPFVNHQVMSVLLLGIVTGIAIRFIPDEDAKKTITQFFRGAHGLFMVITSWVITIIPLGLYGFITSTVLQLREGVAIKGLSQYLLIIVFANLIQGLVVLPLWLKWQGVKPLLAFKGMMPALSVAFFSKSSVGTLPVTMETVEKNLNVKPEISRFVLPLCTSINMNGCAAFIFTTVIYLMQNNGTHVSLAMMAVWVLVATIAAIGNAGVPMGCFFLSASLLASMNVPITLLGLILPFYSLIDMLETALNVWSDSCVAKVVNQKAYEADAKVSDEIVLSPHP